MRALVDRTHRNVDNGRQGNVMTTWGRTRRIGALSSGRLFLRSAILCLSLLALAGGLTGVSMGQGDHALLVEIDAAINSVTAGYLDRAMEKAAEDEAELIIVQLDTPGGLLDSTRDMVSDLLDSKVPTVVYVAPAGARAASAGTFIAAAAHFAVMAPATNIGAASPVSSDGEELPDTIKSKVTEDAAALMRDIATERGRNVEKLEETVLNAVAYTSEEAVDLNVVDFVADNLEDLLNELDGRVAETPFGPVTLSTEGLDVRRLEMTLVEKFLLILSNPNISFLLVTIGGLAVMIELFNFGMIVPGLIGVTCLLLAFVALGNLPVNWAGVAFILLALVLLGLEAMAAGIGVLGVGAVVSFVIGGLLLFHSFGPTSPTLPDVRVNIWLILGTAVLLLGGGGWFVMTMVKSRQTDNPSTADAVVGEVGMVTSDLAPTGMVQLPSGLWSAIADNDEVIMSGERVRVVSMEGLTVNVQRTR